MISKLIVLKNSIAGYFYKWLVDLHFISVPSLNQSKRDKQIIVSLTSYGRRISSSVVYYSLVSILRQSVQPDKVILWIDKNKWNNDNLPAKLKSLIPKGIEYGFCEDVRSYTKLVPSLEKYAEDIIITLDDDIIYASDTIQRLYDAHLSHPDTICCMNPLKLHVENGYPCKYETWVEYPDVIEGHDQVFPCGVDSVLYPPHCLDELATNRDLFKKLCPLADDVWFWFCGCLKGTKKIGINRKASNYSFDALYQYFHQGSALTHANRFEHQNDKQIRDIFDHFGVTMVEGKITKR